MHTCSHAKAGGQLHVAVAGTTMNDEIRQFISRRKKMRRAVEKASQEKAMQVGEGKASGEILAASGAQKAGAPWAGTGLWPRPLVLPRPYGRVFSVWFLSRGPREIPCGIVWSALALPTQSLRMTRLAPQQPVNFQREQRVC